MKRRRTRTKRRRAAAREILEALALPLDRGAARSLATGSPRGFAEPTQTRVGGRLDIRVDTETGQTRVTRLESESRDFELEVDTGLALGTP